jgi:hypothetical protein
MKRLLGIAASFLMTVGAGAVLAVAPGPLPAASTAHAQSSAWCGDVGQRACGPADCRTQAGWFLFVYAYEVCPPPCNPGLTSSGGICRAPAAACDIGCKIAKIKQVLGAPSGLVPGKTMYCFGAAYDPYSGRKASRADLGISPSDKSVHIDVGGEGLYMDSGRQWGSNEAINLNCSLNQTTTPANEKLAIPNLIFGFGQYMPFTAQFADVITINNSPVYPSEIERVIRPGGVIHIRGTSDSLSKVIEIEKHMCVFPAQRNNGYSVTIDIQVPTNFDYLHPRNCPYPKEEL